MVGEKSRNTLLCVFLRSIIVWVSVHAVSPARAESTQADWDKYATPLVDKFAICTRNEVGRTWNTTDRPEEIAGAAIKACEKHLEPLRARLVEPPFNGTPDELDATMEILRTEILDAAKADVEKRRQQKE